MQNKGHFDVQGYSSSPILVPIGSSYTTSIKTIARQVLRIKFWIYESVRNLYRGRRAIPQQTFTTRYSNRKLSIVMALSNTFTQCAPKAAEFGEKTQIMGHFAVQGHSRSPILVPIESSYTTSYYWLMSTYLLSCTFSEYFPWMSMDGQCTNRRRKIAENFNRLSKVHQQYRQTTDRQTERRYRKYRKSLAIAYSEREREFTFAKHQHVDSSTWFKNMNRDDGEIPTEPRIGQVTCWRLSRKSVLIKILNRMAKRR